MSIWLFYNAFILHLILKFDSEVNSNLYKDRINKLSTDLDEMLQQHSKTFHLIILLLVAIEKSYILYDYSMTRWSFDPKRSLVTKKNVYKEKKAEMT